MYFELNQKQRLYCYGLGFIKYKDDFRTVIGYTEVDSCVKEIQNGICDIGVTDTRDMESSLEVKLSTYMSTIILSTLGALTYVGVKYYTKK